MHGSDLDKYPHALKMICGDLNGDPDTFGELEDLKTRHAWIDLGAAAERWNCESNLPTCLNQLVFGTSLSAVSKNFSISLRLTGRPRLGLGLRRGL